MPSELVTIRQSDFGTVTIVFFRRHVETGAPILDEPQVWVFDCLDGSWYARDQLKQLMSRDDLWVPAGDLTLATLKSDRGD